MLKLKKAILTMVLAAGSVGTVVAADPSYVPPSPFGTPTPPALFGTPKTDAPAAAMSNDALIAMLKEIGVTEVKPFQDAGMSSPAVLFEVQYGEYKWKLALRRLENENLVNLTISFSAAGRDGKTMSPERMSPQVVAKMLKIFSATSYLTTTDAMCFVHHEGGSFVLVTPLSTSGLTKEKLKAAIARQLDATYTKLLPLINELTAADGPAPAAPAAPAFSPVR